MFTAAYIRLAALVIKHEGTHEIDITPTATMIERIHATLGEDTAELIAITIEESK